MGDVKRRGRMTEYQPVYSIGNFAISNYNLFKTNHQKFFKHAVIED